MVTQGKQRNHLLKIRNNAMAKWRYYSYDVWGNAKEGYDVNNVFKTNEIVDIPNVVRSDKALLTFLKNIGFFKKSLKVTLFDTDGDDEVIYLNYRGKPEGELRKER